jgi:hypothetical protein
MLHGTGTLAELGRARACKLAERERYTTSLCLARVIATRQGKQHAPCPTLPIATDQRRHLSSAAVDGVALVQRRLGRALVERERHATCLTCTIVTHAAAPAAAAWRCSSPAAVWKRLLDQAAHRAIMIRRWPTHLNTALSWLGRVMAERKRHGSSSTTWVVVSNCCSDLTACIPSTRCCDS